MRPLKDASEIYQSLEGEKIYEIKLRTNYTAKFIAQRRKKDQPAWLSTAKRCHADLLPACKDDDSFIVKFCYME